MNYLVLLFNTFTIFNISAFKIKIGKNIDNFIFKKWEYKKEEKSNYRINKTHEDKLEKDNEKLFLLLETTDFNKNIFETCYYINKKKEKFYDVNSPGIYEKIYFKIDFSKDKPKYNIVISDYEIKNNLLVESKDYDLTKEDILKEKLKLFLNDKEIKDKDKYDDVKKIINDLSKGFEEKRKCWALFKIKIKNDNKEKYFYCNDIESEFNIGGIFDKNIEEIEVIKSNCDDVYFMLCFTSNCFELKKLDLTKLKVIGPIDISQMFFYCKCLEEVKFPKGLKVDNISLLFGDSNDIKNINFEDLDMTEGFYSMDLLCEDSKMKKLKFPKCIIYKRTKFISDKKDSKEDTCIDEGFLANNNLEEIDLTNVEIKEGAGEGMFKKNTVKKLILSEKIKNLSEQQLRAIFNESDIKIIKIGKYELKIEEYDQIAQFIKNSEDYLKGREKIKEIYYYSKNNNNNNNNNNNSSTYDIKDKDISNCKCCLTCMNNCCICKKNK